MEVESEVRQSKFKRICVFCGSSQGKKSSYQDAAIELGKELVFNNCFFLSHVVFLFASFGYFLFAFEHFILQNFLFVL